MSAREASDSWVFGDAVPPGDAGAAPRRDPASYRAGDPFGAQYVIRSELGKGGMGVVYRARDLATGRDVALKLLLATLSQRGRERFRREGELTAALRHPGIVQVHAGGEIEGTPYLAYELIPESRTFQDALSREPREERLRLLVEVAAAVAHAHSQGVVHRDLKPENILLDAEGRARVADFGLAKGAQLEQLTETGAVVGTPAYMSPEQFAGEAVSPATDVWALGVILYQCLAGELPFQARTTVDLMALVVSGNPEPLRRRDRTISPGLESVCLKALEKEPRDRYADAGALAADLQRALSLQPVSASSPFLRSLARIPKRGLLLVLASAAAFGLALHALLGSEPGTPAVARKPLVPSGEGLRREAARSLEAGAIEEASRLCERYLNWRPGDPRGLRLQVRIQLAAGLVGVAERSLAKLAATHPGPATAVLEAEVAHATGGDAGAVLRTALARWPDRSELKSAHASHLFLHQHKARAAQWVLGSAEGRQASRLRATLTALLGGPPDLEVLARGASRWREAAVAWLLAEGLRELAWVRRPLPASLGGPSIDRRSARARGALQAVLSLAKEDRFARGRAHLALADLEGVETEAGARQLGLAARVLPRDWRVVRLEASRLLARGNAAQAAALLERDSAPSSALLRGRALLRSGRAGEAVELLRAARAANPLDPVACQALAEALEASGRTAEAREAREYLSLLRGSRRAEAVRLYDVLRAKYNPIPPGECQRVLALDPRHKFVRFIMGRELFVKGKYLEGMRECLSIVERDPTYVSQLCGAMLALSVSTKSFFRAGSLEGILARMQRVETSFDRRAKAFLTALVVEFERRRGRLSEGLRALDRVLREGPSRVWARILRSLLYLRAGRMAEARGDLSVVAEATPELGLLAFAQALFEAHRGGSTREVERLLRQSSRQGFAVLENTSHVAQLYPVLKGHLRRLGK